MTQNEFLSLCNTYGIDPSVALESEAIRVALKNRDNAEVERILSKEF